MSPSARAAGIPPAAEKLYTDLKAASRVAAQLQGVEPDEDLASLLVGLRDVLDYAARVLGASYGPDPRYTLQQAHGLASAAAHVRGDAEVLRDRKSTGR